MHLKKSQISRSLPVPRKGTKYIARASSHFRSGVPAVVAVRDMLHLASNAKEVKKMVLDKLIKINNKTIKDIKEPIKLFNILKVGKNYVLTILPTGRFSFEEVKEGARICRVDNKRLLNKDDVQINLHDGTNIIIKNKEKISYFFNEF